jgi:hypothetical protein
MTEPTGVYEPQLADCAQLFAQAGEELGRRAVRLRVDILYHQPLAGQLDRVAFADA